VNLTLLPEGTWYRGKAITSYSPQQEKKKKLLREGKRETQPDSPGKKKKRPKRQKKTSQHATRRASTQKIIKNLQTNLIEEKRRLNRGLKKCVKDGGQRGKGEGEKVRKRKGRRPGRPVRGRTGDSRQSGRISVRSAAKTYDTRGNQEGSRAKTERTRT